MVTHGRRAWVRGYVRRGFGPVDGTQSAIYRLNDLMQRGLLDRDAGHALLTSAGLRDFRWQVTWAADAATPPAALEAALADAEAVVVFVHGWTGNHRIWESLPARVVSAMPRTVALAVDHNGFGGSRFRSLFPAFAACDPPAAMRVLQRWVDLLGLRRQPGEPGQRVVHMVGHSMGGATLFYLDPLQWRHGEVTRYALAPALLLEAEIQQVFYTALGAGISLVQRMSALEVVERLLKPAVLNVLTRGSSRFVRAQHARQYAETERGVTGATFMAMGLLRNTEIPHDWNTFRVMLTHRDQLVRLTDMIDLLGKLEFPAAHLRVVPGTHYVFSVPEAAVATPRHWHLVAQHAQSREVILDDIALLHERALAMQRRGPRAGGRP